VIPSPQRRSSVRVVYLLVALALLGPGRARAQRPSAAPPSQALAGAGVKAPRGTLKDARTGAPLGGVIVFIAETGDSVPSGDDGVFVLPELPPGHYTLGILDEAFKKLERHIVVSEDKGIAPLTLRLEPSGKPSTEQIVEVAEQLERPSAGSTVIQREEITRVPGSRGDLLTAVKSLPGIANNGAFGPQAGGVVIRGSSPFDSKVLVDGFEVPILYHFGGIQSVLPSELIDDLVYTPGGFTVDQGRATGGTIAATSRRATRKEWKGFGEISFINAAALAQGPVGEKTAVLVAARRSFIDAILPAVLPKDANLSFTTLPRYYDYQTRIDHTLDDRNVLSLFLFGSDDAFELATDEVRPNDPALTGRFSNTTRFSRGIASWAYGHKGLSNRLSLSGLTSSFSFEIGADRYVRIGTDAGTLRDELRHVVDDTLTLIGGAEATYARIDIAAKAPRPPREGEARFPNFTLDPLVLRKEAFNVGLFAGWAAVEVQPRPWIKLTPGVRVDHFSRQDGVPVQPRLQSKFTLDEGTYLRAAGGLYAKPPDQDENLQKGLQPEKALQSSVGVERQLAPGLTLQVTGFYNHKYDLIVYKAGGRLDATGDAVYANQGVGRTYGGEVFAQVRKSDFFGWASYTVARSERRDLPGQAYRLFDFDQTHNVIALGSWKFGSEKQWQIGGRFQLTTGKPYTPVTGSVFKSDQNVYLPEFGPTNSQRVNTQHQLDLRIDHVSTFKRWKLSTYLDVQNVYANAAELSYQYNFDYTKREAFKNIPILPALGVRGEF